MSTSEEFATCSEELGLGSPRHKSRTQTRISVNTKHQFTCFDCVRAPTRMLGQRSRMKCKCTLTLSRRSVEYSMGIERQYQDKATDATFISLHGQVILRHDIDHLYDTNLTFLFHHS